MGISQTTLTPSSFSRSSCADDALEVAARRERARENFVDDARRAASRELWRAAGRATSSVRQREQREQRDRTRNVRAIQFNRIRLPSGPERANIAALRATLVNTYARPRTAARIAQKRKPRRPRGSVGEA